MRRSLTTLIIMEDTFGPMVLFCCRRDIRVLEVAHFPSDTLDKIFILILIFFFESEPI
jgi:hypothetical protein